MLNISKNSVRNNIRTEDYKSFGHVIAVRGEIKLAKAFVIVLFLLLAISFLPWPRLVLTVSNKE